MNVSVSAVKVFIVVLIICCHSDNFMIRNETLVCYMLLLHLSIITDYLMLKNVIHSFQETTAFRVEEIGDGTFLKSPFADQVMGSC